nr:MAG TPA: hypothetical protein [Caudoviricetes sp.]
MKLLKCAEKQIGSSWFKLISSSELKRKLKYR